MPNVEKITIEVTKELAKYIEKYGAGYVEIITRRKDAKFQSIPKCKRISNATTDSDKIDELINAVTSLKENNSIGIEKVRSEMSSLSANVTDGMAKLSNSTKEMATNVNNIFKATGALKGLSFVQIGLSVVNIAVDIAGFVIINKKMNLVAEDVRRLETKVDGIVSGQKNELVEQFDRLYSKFNTISYQIGVGENVEFKELDMLTSEMAAYIKKLFSNIESEVYDVGDLLCIINELLPIYSVILCELIDKSYFSYHRITENYSADMYIFSKFEDPKFLTALEDYLLFDCGMSFVDATDAINAQRLIAMNKRLMVEDQVELVKVLETKENLKAFDAEIDLEVRNQLEDMIPRLANETGYSESECRRLLLVAE